MEGVGEEGLIAIGEGIVDDKTGVVVELGLWENSSLNSLGANFSRTKLP